MSHDQRIHAMTLVAEMEAKEHGPMPSSYIVYPSKPTGGGCCSKPEFSFDVFQDRLKMHKFAHGTCVQDGGKWVAKMPDKNWVGKQEPPGCCGGMEKFHYGSVGQESDYTIEVNPHHNSGYVVKDSREKERFFILANPNLKEPTGCCSCLPCCGPSKVNEDEQQGGGCCPCCGGSNNQQDAVELKTTTTFDAVHVEHQLKSTTKNIHGLSLFRTNKDGDRDPHNPKGFFDYSTTIDPKGGGCCAIGGIELFRDDCTGPFSEGADTARNVSIMFQGSGPDGEPTKEEEEMILGLVIRDVIRMMTVQKGTIHHPLSDILQPVRPHKMQ